jgi:NADPH2:quinone reductase
MKVVRIHEFGDEDVLRYEDAPVPAPGPGELLIKMEAASVNGGDLRIRQQGNSLIGPQDLPVVLGRELAGTVAAMGPEVSGFHVGQRVVTAPLEGCYVEYIVAPTARTRPLPEGVSTRQAAGIPMVFLTALWTLREAETKPGDRVLVHAGGGGVGMAAIQLAKWMGASVLTTAGTDEKCVRLLALGADEAINYTTSEFGEEVMRRTGGRGVDVVLDTVGADVYTGSLQVLAPGGRMVSIGRTAGEPPSPAPKPPGGRRVQNFSVNGRLSSSTDRIFDLDTILGLVNDGTCRVIIDREFPLVEVGAAHRYMAARRNFGKVLLVSEQA